MVTVSSAIWVRTLSGLALRSRGQVESACLWVGKRTDNEWRVEDVIFLDDLAGSSQNKRWHRLSTEGIDSLFELLRLRGQQIIGDIHTHGGHSVAMSWLDINNPIEYRVGLLAMIVPHHAKHAQYSLSMASVGVYRYMGSGSWHTLLPNEVAATIRLT